jgi:protein gp37
MASSEIEWTDATWNPSTGCNKVSPGCKFCYAERFSERLQVMGVSKYEHGFAFTLHPEVLKAPLHWHRSQRIFVNSMSDLFHEAMPLSFLQAVFAIMEQAHWHQFQVLTKRAERLQELSPLLTWAPNIWMGVSVENSRYAHRIDLLRQTGAQTRFLSLEPLLGPLPNLNLAGIDWVIVGGESGLKPRPMRPEWVLDIRDQCLKADVPFFFKQWGGRNKKRNGRLLEGRTWDEMPNQLPALELV